MWMAVLGAGGVFGLMALAGIVYSIRKVESPKKFGYIAGCALFGMLGLYMLTNATAIAPPAEAQEINDLVDAEEDFDADFDEDF